ncbi:MAG: UvrD-helicase domain-containing protein, partial [Olegusella sp.]|nr:UvrD-helicase domain-containing protein [Olegusella sp.]
MNTQPLRPVAMPGTPAPQPTPLPGVSAPLPVAMPNPATTPAFAPEPAARPAWSGSSAVDIGSLNPAQREAALCTSGPLLVLAGAGSGKTRVLTYRIAHMISDEGVRPWQVLAITFTNKAAAEMRERLNALLPGGTRGMWVCTFHAMCVRMLREDADKLGYKSNFTIYDDDDSKRLVKSIMAELDIDPKQLPLQAIRSRISQAKNAMVSAEEMSAQAAGDNNPLTRKAARVYSVLQDRLARANAMDFDDLLIKAHELLSQHPDVLERYQERFRQISVDEYQDTNHVQYEITNLLAAKYKNLMVVGDDDQSIYSWRGADIKNILSFEKDYPDAHVVKLEQNYRSTGHILNAANAVVAHNSHRKAKRLFTDAGDGEKIRVYQAADERDEGRWIGSEIEKLHDKGTSYDDVAVFYRTNAQSRILEDMFLRAGVPYKIVGGTRFFDRQEVRDVMAYLKVVVNPDDDVAALRVVNTPRRGIGSTSIGKIRTYAAENRISFFAACEACIAEQGLLSPKVRGALSEFTGTIEAGRHMTGELSDVVEAIIDRSGLIRALEAEHSVEADSRIENIKEFY